MDTQCMCFTDTVIRPMAGRPSLDAGQELLEIVASLAWVRHVSFIHRNLLESTVLAHVRLGPRIEQRDYTFIIGLERLVLSE